MERKKEFLIQKKGKKTKISLHKDIYSLDSIKETFESNIPFRQEKNYWKVELNTSSAKDILQRYNYLLYLNRRNE